VALPRFPLENPLRGILRSWQKLGYPAPHFKINFSHKELRICRKQKVKMIPASLLSFFQKALLSNG
jgi:hypothetical protein